MAPDARFAAAAEDFLAARGSAVRSLRSHGAGKASIKVIIVPGRRAM
jgi:hypothetical protein